MSQAGRQRRVVSPLIATGSPCSNDNSRYSASALAASGELVSLENVLGWFCPWVFQDSAFIGDVHQVCVGRIRFRGRSRHWYVVLLRVGDQVDTTLKVPVAPWRNHFNIRFKRIIGEFEADLIVTFSGSAVSDRVGPFYLCDLDLSLRNDRTRQRSISSR